MRHLTLRASIIVSVAVIGVMLKAGRYGSETDNAGGDALAHAARILTAHGWTEVARSDTPASSLYEQRSFTRQGCAEPVVVAVLEGNAEGAQFFRAQHGGDAAFLQGELVELPSGFRRQLAKVTHDLGRMVGLRMERALPVLAIAPAPPELSSSCLGPPAGAWRR